MPVAMVQVREVRMAVAQRCMAVRVRMRLGPLLALMLVLMVGIIDVAMLVVRRLVLVLVSMPLGQGKPGAERRQRECGDERGRQWFIPAARSAEG